MSKTTLITNDTSRYVLDMLDEQGLVVDRETDISRPSLPTDITELDDEDLMRLYTHLSAYSEFLSTQLACAIIDEKDAERNKDYAESEAMLRHQTNNAKTTVTIIKALVDGDPTLGDIRQEALVKYSYRKMLETMVNNYERSTAVCSRELTRRTSSDNFKTRSRKFTT
jgi:hypothetical protein